MDAAAVGAIWRRALEQALDFRAALDDRPQRPESGYAELLKRVGSPMPVHPLGADAVVGELIDWAQPGLNAMAGPRFFAWVLGASHPVGVAADMLTSAWGQNAGNHAASPAAAVAEAVAANWLLDLLDLPRDASVGFVTGATVATFVGLAAARSHVLRECGWDVEADGLFGAPPVSVIIGKDAHTTVLSALRFLGLGHDRVLRVETDAQGAMRPDAFARTLAGTTGPAIVILQAGQINTGAFDPFRAIVPLAKAKAAWVHVDGAFGLWARACPARAALADGIELADSWATDGHKWLQTPFDSGYAVVRHAEAHRRAMISAASYLPPSADGDRDPSHFVPELSRRARGFATWAMLRHLGRDGVAAMVERHCRWCRRMAEALAAEPGVAVLNDVVLNQAIVQFGSGRPPEIADELTERTIARIQSDGICFVHGARWRERWVMRLSVISGSTTEADVERSIAAILAAWRQVRSTFAARAMPAAV